MKKNISNIKKFSQLFTIFDESLLGIFNFIVAILISRIFSIEIFGIYVSLMIPIYISNAIQYSIIGLPLNLEGSKINKNNIQNFYISAFRSAFSTSIIFLLLISMCLYIYTLIADVSFTISNVILYLVFYFLLFQYDFIKRFFYSKNKFILFSLFNISFVFLFFISFYLLYNSSHISSLDKILLSYIISIFISFVIFYKSYFLYIKKNFLFIFSDDSFEFIRSHLIYSKNIFNSSIIRVFSENIFYFFCVIFISATELGTLRLIKSIFGINLIFYRSMENILPKMLYEIYLHNSRTYFFKFYKKVFILYFTIPILIFLFIYFFKEDISLYLFNNNSSKYDFFYILWFFVYLFMALTYFMNHYFVIIKKTFYIFKSSLFMFYGSIFISPLLLYTFNFYGSLISLFLIYFAPLLFCFSKFKHEITKV